MKINKDFITGAISTFILTSALFTIILTEGFVAKNFLRQNSFYLDGHYYKLQRLK